MRDKFQCAIYTRVSTDNQAEVEFNSCEAQEAKIKSFITSQEDMEVFKVYSDPGFTGANLDRPAFQELLEDVRQKQINLVIAYKIDRLTRSPKDFYNLIEVFDKYGVNFISVTERFDTSTPSGRLLRNIMLTFAQFERELTSERTKDKMIQRFNKGMWNGGISPFGYKDENKRLVIDIKESGIVKNIYESYINSRSLAKVCENLKHNSITYRNGRLFSNTTIAYILRNPVYTGKVKFGGKLTQGNHQPIIAQEVFQAVQAIHKDKKIRMKLYKDFPLAGIIRCKECGSIMSPHYVNKPKGRKLERYYYYRCSKTKHNGWHSCSTKEVSANRLEHYILDNLERISLDKQYLENLIFRLNNQESGVLRCAQDKKRTNLPGSSTNPGNFGHSGYRSGVELPAPPPKITPEIFGENLAAFLKFLPKKGIEKSLWVKKFIPEIIYSPAEIRLKINCFQDFARPPAGDSENKNGEANNASPFPKNWLDTKRMAALSLLLQNTEVVLPNRIDYLKEKRLPS